MMKKQIRWLVIVLGFIGAFLGIMFLHFYIVTEGDYPVEATVEQNPSLPHLHIGATILHGEIIGNTSGEMIIVIHGGPGKDFRYLQSLKELSDDYSLLFYDQRGTGLSPRVDASELTMEHLRQDLHKIVLSYAGGRKVNLIGHSWGALLAYWYASSFPNQVNKVVLAEPWILPVQSKPKFKKSWMSWFESRHVKGPDQEAGRDYYFSALLDTPVKSGEASGEYWRYGTLARKTILNSGPFEDGHINLTYLNPVMFTSERILYLTGKNHSIPMNQHLIDPFKLPHSVSMIGIENTEHLFEGQNEACIDEIRQFFKN